MTDNDDEETLAFVASARRALAVNDPVPAEISSLAKLAFQFRDSSTTEAIGNEALAGVRSSSAELTMQASKDGITVVWSVGSDTVQGVVQPATGSAGIQLTLQTAERSVTVAVDPTTGIFEYPDPKQPHRLLVAADATQWATPWTT